MAKKLNQKDRVLRHLETYGSIDPRQAYFDYSIMRLAAVIFNLKEEGHNIKSETITSKNKFNEPVSYAKYTLAIKQEPKEEQSLLGDLFESFTKIYK
jgi:hypothetical protein